MRRNAVCIGVNYEGTPHALAGCINDADDWASYLDGCGFKVGVLAEAQATKGLIAAALSHLKNSLEPGDVGVITFSGHGTWVPDLDGDEPDRKDEALVPWDAGVDGANLLLDDELHALLAGRAPRTRIVLITDCCHSGTVFRFFNPQPRPGTRRVRYLPPATFARAPATVAAVQRLGPEGPRPSNAAVAGLIHYSGCQDHEYSFDAAFADRSNGAFSRFALQAARALLPGASYADWHRAVRRLLPSAEYPQTPKFSATRSERKLPLFT